MSRPVFNALRSQSRFLWGLNPSLPQVLYRFLFPTITNLNHLPSGNIAIQQKNGATTPKNTPLTIKMELEKCWFPKGSISFSMFRFYLNLWVSVTTCLFKKRLSTSAPPSRIINCVSHPVASERMDSRNQVRHRKKTKQILCFF